MKRVSGLLVVLALTAVGGALVYQAAAREQQYRVLLGRGDQALAEGQTFGAIEAFSEAIGLRPESMLAHLRRGETYRQRGDLDAAARDFRRAAMLDPSATRPLDALGDVLYQRQRFKSAAEVYESRLQLDDRSEQAAYRLALARYRDGNIDGTLAAATQAIRLNDQSSDAYYLFGLCLKERNRLPEAIDAFATAIARTPNMISAREELADAYAAAGRQAEELEQLQYIALLDRGHVERQVAVGLAHARNGHGELAVLTLGNALDQTPDQTLVYGALGKVWLDMASTRSDALSKALEALERVASTAGATSDVMTLYGRALLQADQPEAAERALQQATERYPVEPEAFLTYADLAERQNHLAAARTALISYAALEGTNEGSISRTARIASLSLRMNEPVAAAEWFERASEAAPNDVGLLASLADAQLKAGDRDAARATVARGTDKDPQNAQLLALARKLGIRN